MVELFGRGLLERDDLRSLGIQPAHDVFDDAVFAGSIHRLEDDEERPAILSVKPFLKHPEPRDTGFEPCDCWSLVLERAHVGGIVATEDKLLAGAHTKTIGVHGAEPREPLSRREPASWFMLVQLSMLTTLVISSTVVRPSARSSAE